MKPYDERLGCLAFPQDGVWLVVEPSGKLIACTGNDEYEARAIAQYHNLVGDLCHTLAVPAIAGGEGEPT
jgi:hypothetical protein